MGGQVLAPGFIDLHTHARRGIFEVPTADNYVLQGVTTLFEGQDGDSPLPIHELLTGGGRAPACRQLRHVRRAWLGARGRARKGGSPPDRRGAGPDGRHRRGIHARRRLRAEHGSFLRPRCLRSHRGGRGAGRAAGRLGGIHISHMRDEAAGILQSVGETIAIGEEGGLPTQITHHKIIGRGRLGPERRDPSPRRSGSSPRRRRDNRPVPLHRLVHLLLGPLCFRRGRSKGAGRGCRSASPIRRVALASGTRSSTRSATSEAGAMPRVSRWRPARTTPPGREEPGGDSARAGEGAHRRGGGGPRDRDRRGRRAIGIFHAIAEEDVERILASPFTMVASDGGIPIFGQGAPHPRSYGTFVRVLGVYVRERGILSLEDGVRKMTSLPASRVGLLDRGIVRPRDEGRPRRLRPGDGP